MPFLTFYIVSIVEHNFVDVLFLSLGIQKALINIRT